MPVWGVFMAFALAAVYLIPVGTVFAGANLKSNMLTVLERDYFKLSAPRKADCNAHFQGETIS